MFDLGWDEMAIIAVVALVVLGPKELPGALRTVSALMKNARKLAGEFQSGVNEIIREADLEDARKKLNEVTSLNKNQIQQAIEKHVDPTGEVKSALTIEDDPAVPAKPAIEAPAEPAAVAAPSTAADSDVEDAAVEAAAAKPTALETSDPDETPIPETVAAEKS